jgi:hypothetical protein
MATSASAPTPGSPTASADVAAGETAAATGAEDTEEADEAGPVATSPPQRRFLALGDARAFLTDLPSGSTPRMMRIGERQLGMHLLDGFYATVTLQPNRALDPVPADVPTTDRVLVGLRWMVRF